MNASHLSRLGSLIALAMASKRSTVSPVMVHKLLSGIAIVVGLAVTLGLCVGSLIIAGVYSAYKGLVAHGLETNIALLSVLFLMLLIITLLIVILRDRIRGLRQLPGAIIQSEAPFVTDIKQTVTAFMDGLTGRNVTREP